MVTDLWTETKRTNSIEPIVWPASRNVDRSANRIRLTKSKMETMGDAQLKPCQRCSIFKNWIRERADVQIMENIQIDFSFNLPYASNISSHSSLCTFIQSIPQNALFAEATIARLLQSASPWEKRTMRILQKIPDMKMRCVELWTNYEVWFRSLLLIHVKETCGWQESRILSSTEYSLQNKNTATRIQNTPGGTKTIT